MRKSPLVFITLLALLALTSSAVPAHAQADTDQALLERYAPVFYFHPDEYFRPQPVEVMLPEARLRRSTPLWFDVNVLARLNLPDFLTLPPEKNFFIDVWYGDSGAATDYTAHRSYYNAVLSPDAGGLEPAVYGRVHRDAAGHVTLQYWAFYYYNDWFNKHEGDWEMIQVMLDPDGTPCWVVYSQHHGGTRRAWEDTPREEQTHPMVFVAKGSHANYFVGDESYPNGMTIGKTRIEILDRTGRVDRLRPRIIRLPERGDVLANPQAWPGAEWLPYRGRWGENAPQGDFSGPYGPADKGDQWGEPYAWGMAQPLDVEVWYAHRLRVLASIPLRATLTPSLGNVTTLSNGLILHSDPPAEGVAITLQAAPHAVADIQATWPDRSTALVTRLTFLNVTFDATGQALLILGPQSAQIAIGQDTYTPNDRVTYAATWDAPDLVWMGTLLTAQEVVVGLGWILIGSILPALLLLGLIYNLDFYEREPRRLVSLTFLWGAVPAVLVLLAAFIFFRLPALPLAREAHIAVRTGILSAVFQELVKGAAVLFIAWRYRNEFDGVFDGLVYGAAVGLGYAMISHLLRQLSDFIQWGFASMSLEMWAQGLLYTLHHAMYSALFGTALGWARLERDRRKRIAVPVLGMLVAILVHLLHLRWLNSLEGLTPLTVILSLAGVVFFIGVGTWALLRQRAWLQATLPRLLPADVSAALLKPERRWWHETRALFRHGPRAWLALRRFHVLSMEWAFKAEQARLRPDEPALAAEAERLKTRLLALWPRVQPYLSSSDAARGNPSASHGV